jgi:hypothetical protein
MNIRKSLLMLLVLVVFYFIAWTGAYVFFVGFDFQYYCEYLRLSWTAPGEIPLFIQLFALGMTAICFAGFLGWKLWSREQDE